MVMALAEFFGASCMCLIIVWQSIEMLFSAEFLCIGSFCLSSRSKTPHFHFDWFSPTHIFEQHLEHSVNVMLRFGEASLVFCHCPSISI